MDDMDISMRKVLQIDYQYLNADDFCETTVR